MTELEMNLFWDYLIFNDWGLIEGIRDDAPESAKIEYEKFVVEQAEAKQQGCKI